MKLTTTLTATFAATLLWSGIATADIWKGSGTMYNKDRSQLASYTLTLDLTESSDGRTSKVNVLVSDGSTMEINCKSLGTANSWSKTCDNGMNGGGYFFENGLISEYVENGSGRAQASTIIFDSDNEIRILRTELDQNEVKYFFVESLTKIAK